MRDGGHPVPLADHPGQADGVEDADGEGERTHQAMAAEGPGAQPAEVRDDAEDECPAGRGQVDVPR